MSGTTGIAKYAKLMALLRQQMQDKAFGADGRLPSENELVRRYGVSLITARRAYSEMAASGEIIRIKGKGTFCGTAPAPQNGAHAMRASKVVTFVLLDYREGDESMMKIILGAQTVLSKQGFHMTIESSNCDVAAEQAILERCYTHGIAGVLLFSTNPDASVRSAQRLGQAGIPLVFIDRGPTAAPCSLVASNNFDGAWRMAAHLYAMGHRTILYAGDRRHINTEAERLRGFTGFLAQAGAFDETLCFFDAFNQLEAILDCIRTRRATAVCCVNDKLAVWLLNALRKHHVCVPEAVSVAGFDDTLLARSSVPPLTTVRQDFERMGAMAAQAVLEKIQHPKREGNLALGIPTELVLRASVRDLQAYVPPKEKNTA